MKLFSRNQIAIILVFWATQNFSQITPEDYDPFISSPAYPDSNGTIIYLDEGHYNRHTYGGLGSFIAFKNVLLKDGYRISPIKKPFAIRNLEKVKILVIPLAQHRKNLEPRWFNPTYSAFRKNEIKAIVQWIASGGSLFLIVDHHPFAGASSKLARALGFELYNGHAEDLKEKSSNIFSRDSQTLTNNIITNGRTQGEKVDSIKTFAGAAMRIGKQTTPILIFDENWVQYLPDTAWNYSHIRPSPINGFHQGAFKEFENGKIVIFCDGNMFSAQIDEDGEMAGFIDPEANDNYQLLLNIIHYLDGLLDHD